MFTVILHRPERLRESQEFGYAQDIYVAHRPEADLPTAISAARSEVCWHDRRDLKVWTLRPAEYSLVAVFAGHITPVYYGWQA